MLSAGPHRTIRPLRFVRWSRRPSATFHSIGKEVIIGHLAGNVVERLSLKSTRGTSTSRRGMDIRHKAKAEIEEGLHESICLLDLREAAMLLSVMPVTSDEGGIGSVRYE